MIYSCFIACDLLKHLAGQGEPPLQLAYCTTFAVKAATERAFLNVLATTAAVGGMQVQLETELSVWLPSHISLKRGVWQLRIGC